MAFNRAQMEAEMMRFEQEISLPPAAPVYRPPVSFIPQQVMRQQQTPLLAARPSGSYAYNNWNSVSAAAAYGAHSHQPIVPQQVPTMYNQPPNAAMWPGQAALPVGDQMRAEPSNARGDAKWKITTRTVISAPPNVISAPPAYNTQAQPVVAGPTQPESTKSVIAATKTPASLASASTGVVKAASASTSAPKPTSTSSSSKPSTSSNSKPAAPTEDASGGTSTTAVSKKKVMRTAAGKTWEDPSMADWDPNDFRIFVGDLGNEATDEMLARLFNGYASFQRARVVRDPRTNKVKGYGFVSFRDPKDFLRAMKEVNGRYCGNRPVKLMKSVWKERSTPFVRKREKEKMKLGLK